MLLCLVTATSDSHIPRISLILQLSCSNNEQLKGGAEGGKGWKGGDGAWTHALLLSSLPFWESVTYAARNNIYFYSSSGALAYRLCSPHSTWSHLYRIFFELRGKSAFLHLREKKDRILAWLIILLQWHSAFEKKRQVKKKVWLKQNASAHELENFKVSASFHWCTFLLLKQRAFKMKRQVSCSWHDELFLCLLDKKNDSHKIVHLN